MYEYSVSFFGTLLGLMIGSLLIQKGINRWQNRANTGKIFGAILFITFGLSMVLPMWLGIGKSGKLDPINVLTSTFCNYIGF